LKIVVEAPNPVAEIGAQLSLDQTFPAA